MKPYYIKRVGRAILVTPTPCVDPLVVPEVHYWLFDNVAAGTRISMWNCPYEPVQVPPSSGYFDYSFYPILWTAPPTGQQHALVHLDETIVNLIIMQYSLSTLNT